MIEIKPIIVSRREMTVSEDFKNRTQIRLVTVLYNKSLEYQQVWLKWVSPKNGHSWDKCG